MKSAANPAAPVQTWRMLTDSAPLLACGSPDLAGGGPDPVPDAVEARWEVINRWGPYVLLAFSALLAVGTADLVMDTTERYVAAYLVVAAIGLQLWWDRAGWSKGRPRSAPGVAGAVYYGVRWALGFALSWVNPFMAFYAVVGYFGAERLLPARLVRVGLVASAVTMAGSESGGLPPQGRTGWLVFGALLAVNVSLLLIFSHLAQQEDERGRTQRATIKELERTNARLQQALDENAALHAQLLFQAREAGVADERRRLAAEIHDTIAQGLTGIIAQLQVVSATPDPDAARVHVDRATDLARHSLGEARRSVQNLAPAVLENATLPEALRTTTERWAQRAGAEALFTVTGAVEPLHDEVGSTLLRIAEEALSNAARHARAQRVGVTLSFMGEEVTLDVRDDGTGFDPAAVPPRTASGGFGLDGMRARAERVAGTLTVESEPGLGTAVSARVPLVPDDR